ncbi:MAG TPA: FtsL-like putative cell division protein [Flavipsychrobacter sp.]|nr:FtsL-like putative cell division protein [Flavipsychrobacter sp.]
MQHPEDITTQEQEEILLPPTTAERVRSDWRAFLDKLSYKGIVNNVPFLAFLVLLTVIYITNNQRTIEIQRELNKQNLVLKELRWKYMDIKSQLMNAGMETEIIRNSAGIGMKPMLLPAYKIEIDTHQDKTAKK